MRRKGFTLIELLVVIAFIAILAAILYPVFAKAKAKAWSATCQMNLKQLGGAMQMYAMDNDGGLPPPAEGVSSFKVTFDYYKSILVCPSWRIDTTKLVPQNIVPPYGYGANYNVSSINLVNPEIDDKVPMLSETRYGKLWFQTPRAISTRRHGSEFTNIGFLDGHVKEYKHDYIVYMADKAEKRLVFAPEVVKATPVTVEPATPKEIWHMELTSPDGKKLVGDLHSQ